MDRTGWGRGEVSRRTKAGLKGTRKWFYFSQVMSTLKVCVCVCMLHKHNIILVSVCTLLFNNSLHNLYNKGFLVNIKLLYAVCSTV